MAVKKSTNRKIFCVSPIWVGLEIGNLKLKAIATLEVTSSDLRNATPRIAINRVLSWEFQKLNYPTFIAKTRIGFFLLCFLWLHIDKVSKSQSFPQALSVKVTILVCGKTTRSKAYVCLEED